MMNNFKELMRLAIRTFFDGIKNGLSKEEALKLHVTNEKTVYDIFQEDLEFTNQKIYAHQIIPKLITFFKNINNEWTTRAELIEHLNQWFHTTDNSIWGHIYRSYNKHGILEHDKENHVYRLNPKFFTDLQ